MHRVTARVRCFAGRTCERPLADDGRQPALDDVAAHALDLRGVGVVDVLLRREGAELGARPAQLVPAHHGSVMSSRAFDISAMTYRPHFAKCCKDRLPRLRS